MRPAPDAAARARRAPPACLRRRRARAAGVPLQLSGHVGTPRPVGRADALASARDPPHRRPLREAVHPRAAGPRSLYGVPESARARPEGRPSKSSHERAIEPPTTRQLGSNARSHGARNCPRAAPRSVKTWLCGRIACKRPIRDLLDVDASFRARAVGGQKGSTRDRLFDRGTAELHRVQLSARRHARS